MGYLTMGTGTRYDASTKIGFLDDYARLPVGESGRRKGLKALRESYGISSATEDRWLKKDKPNGQPGRKSATSGEPTSNSVYYLGGIRFASKEKAIRYAVEAMGGLTVHTVSTTKTIRKVEL